MTKLSTLCYIEKDDKYLMLHRTVKENDVNKDKWIGVGGHFEYGESPEAGSHGPRLPEHSEYQEPSAYWPDVCEGGI